MKLKQGSKLVMVGDSITDCDRDHGAMLASSNSYGSGYVSLVYAFLTGLMPQEHIIVMNQGVSGNTILDLKNRWQTDVLDLKPDYVSIMIGVNDVWRHFDSVLQPMGFVDEELFEQTYIELIEQTQKQTEQIFIFSPFMIIKEKENAMRQMLDRFGEICKRLADFYGLIYVDVQKEMDDVLKEMNSYMLSGDHVHPNLAGHIIIAKAFLKAIDFEW
jgi:lysophospholipase L1-like esterase